MGHKGATVFSMSQPSPRGLFAPSNGEWATFQIGPLCALCRITTLKHSQQRGRKDKYESQSNIKNTTDVLDVER